MTLCSAIESQESSEIFGVAALDECISGSFSARGAIHMIWAKGGT
jgi:hypothetical protein